MKRFYILVLSIISLNAATGQITLTSANNNPSIGDSFTFQIIDAETLNPGPSGPNIVWDFSTVTPISSFTYNWVNPNTLTENLSFPLSNIAAEDNLSEGYFFIDNDEYSYIGVHEIGQREEVFTDARELYKFPITYGGVFNETFSGTSTNLITAEVTGRGGDIHIEADAYGTLKLPYGIINNVLRLKTVANYNDTSGSLVSSYRDEYYYWFNLNTKSCIFAYNVFTALNSSYINYIAMYLDNSDIVLGLGDDFIRNLVVTLYPNPTNGLVNVSLGGFYQKSSLRILDVTGKIVGFEIATKGSKSLSIDMSEHAKGIYLVQLIRDSEILGSNKLIVN